ncbi:spore germination protein GerPC [Paraliobacillus ryukyuensis]|uniref:spore germination protein GerPC n=1 Tax=Paraliobacillus ryukyuensis TaxID=200904 RepID=UPI0009A638E3|nr:spore germination protein GerPC [Paraliobacillus ryukyuensis]
MYNDAWYQYVEQLHAYMKKQDKLLQNLERRLAELEAKQQSPPSNTTIEKLEYHFDQLKIDRMDGTLHIGFSPEDISKMDDVSIPLEQRQVQPDDHPLVKRLDNYVTQSCPLFLDQLAQELDRPLDETKKSLLVEDIRRQLRERIAFYQKDAVNNQIPAAKQTDYIFSKIKTEIDHGLRAYFKNKE